jgi:MFS family permease
MEKDLNMSGEYKKASDLTRMIDMIKGPQYNISLTIFFISYALFEPLTNAMLKRLTPRIFFTRIVLAWGIIMTLMGLVTSYKGLLAVRFMLGVAEAGLFPG